MGDFLVSGYRHEAPFHIYLLSPPTYKSPMYSSVFPQFKYRLDFTCLSPDLSFVSRQLLRRPPLSVFAVGFVLLVVSFHLVIVSIVLRPPSTP